MKYHIKILFIFCLLFQIINIAKADVDKTLIKNEVKQLIGQCGEKFKSQKNDSALFLINLALNKAHHVRDSHLLLVCYNYMGLILNSQSKYNFCIQAYNNALKYLPNDKYNINRLKLILNIAVVHRKQGQFSKAILVLDKALKSSEFYPKSNTLASCFDEFGLVLKNENSERALLFLHKALEMRKELGNKNNIAKSYNHLGSYYNMKKDYSKAIYNYRKSLELGTELKSNKLLSRVCTNIGNLYLKIGKLDSAQIYYYRSLDIKKTIGNRNGEAIVCAALGELFIQTNEYNKAESYLMRANQIAKEIEILYLQQEIYLQFKNLYAAQNKGQKALYYYDKYIAVKDSIFNTESMKHMQEMETRYQTREKEQQIKLLHLENSNQELLLQKTRLGNWLLTGFALLLLLSILPVYYFIKQKQNYRLLQERSMAENKECNRISRELHDGVVSNLSYLCRWGEDEQVDGHFIQKLRKVSEEIRGISHQLNVNAIGKLAFRESLIDSLDLEHFPKDIDLKIYLPDDFEVEKYDEKMNWIRIIKELLNNSLKYADASIIQIQFLQTGKSIHFQYQDNGRGVDLQQVKPGNGMQNIEDRVKLLTGKMEMNSELGEGFECVITV